MGHTKKITDDFWHAFESGEIAALEKLVDADVRFRMPGVDAHGWGALSQMLAAYKTAFPDLRHDVKSHLEQGDTIAIELEVTGTHTGPMHTPQGTVAATGKRVAWQSCDWVRVRDGKIVSWHVYHDPTAFYAALGIGR